MTVQWDENLSLGHPTIDIQHREILARINGLSDKLNEGADNIEIRNLLNYLSTYADKHFFEEEKLMAEHNYYGINKQKVHHAKFKAEINELNQMLRKNIKPIDLAYKVETALLQYFVDHINGLDKELANFMNFHVK
jgi:hemerythrin